MNRSPLMRFAIVFVAAFLPDVTEAQQDDHPALGAPGFQKHRDYFSEMPFENIDTLSGSVILTFTDLVLPGSAGRELKFQRTYNSKTTRWTFGIAGIPLTISDPPYPTADTPGFQEMTPALHMSDGSVPKMAWFTAPNVNDPNSFNVTISSDFWRLNRVSRTLSIPNGDVCTYEPDIEPYTLRVNHCEDSFGNEIDFVWELSLPETLPRLRVLQEVGEDTREVEIRFISSVVRQWDAVSYDQREWDYGYEPNLTLAMCRLRRAPGGRLAMSDLNSSP